MGLICQVTAQRPEEWHGIMAIVRPFQRGCPVTSAYCQMRPMAMTHSTRDEAWMAHVGTDSALAGSTCHPSALPSRAEPCAPTPGTSKAAEAPAKPPAAAQSAHPAESPAPPPAASRTP